MIGENWVSFITSGSLHGDLCAVVQQRKLFQLGAAFLTRVRGLLPTSADHLALDVTRDYVAGKARMLELVEAWTSAEMDGGEHIWGYEYEYPCCPDCDAEPEEWPFLPGVLHFARFPVNFASRCASVALRLATNCYSGYRLIPNEATLIEASAQYALYLDIIGEACERPQPSPVRLADHPDIRHLLAAIDTQETLDALALLALADALEEAGCDEVRLLRHLRAKQEHFRGCWAVERIAGREMIRLRSDASILTPRGRHAPTRW